MVWRCTHIHPFIYADNHRYSAHDPRLQYPTRVNLGLSFGDERHGSNSSAAHASASTNVKRQNGQMLGETLEIVRMGLTIA